MLTDNPDGVGFTVFGELQNQTPSNTQPEVLQVQQVHSTLTWAGASKINRESKFVNLQDAVGLINAPAAIAAAGYG